MKRRRFQSIALIPQRGYVAICEEGRGWVFTFDDPKWRMLLELPPIDDTDATTAEINRRLNKGFFTRKEFAKDYDRRYGTDMEDFSDSFFDLSLSQPWPEDQASDQVNPGIP